mmetsp:Transcript_16868/g.58709  ORF Transcript_16868/g.58709 Transcript_16868/m.58709 type:complete len:272 (+) Transcript_16868:1557-2372(+)
MTSCAWLEFEDVSSSSFGRARYAGAACSVASWMGGVASMASLRACSAFLCCATVRSVRASRAAPDPYAMACAATKSFSISRPEKPCVVAVTSARQGSSTSAAMFKAAGPVQRAQRLRLRRSERRPIYFSKYSLTKSKRASYAGRPKYSVSSTRSSTASSRSSARFVASTSTNELVGDPVWYRNALSALRMCSVSRARDRDARKASASSMKIKTPVSLVRAQRKRACSAVTPSDPRGPTSPPDMRAYSRPDAAASLRATKVLPVPGGPWRSM